MSNFVVSARKYRPMRFDEVVGQQHVSQTLKNAIANNHLAHAFLFCGPRGVGKTTCARILAKVLNCENQTADHEPCNTCSSCISFNDNASFNITELDAASNNSVEHIRALIEQVRFQPQQGQYKIFIIDEVHMLSQQAFNAFLKTLEEPPPYAKFILATTEKHKIIPTILSRCQIFDFNRIQVQDIIGHLEGICTAEKIAAERDALHIVAEKADGALRDALSIFDRIVSFSNESITYEDVITNLNVLDYDYYFKILDAVLLQDVSNILLIFDEILRKGFDPSVFVNGLAAHFRNILVCQNPATLRLLESGESLKARYKSQAEITPKGLLLGALGLANDCDVNYKMARNKRLHVEMMLIRLAYIQKAVNAAQYTPEKKTPSVTTTTPAPSTKPTSKPVEQPTMVKDDPPTYQKAEANKTESTVKKPLKKKGSLLSGIPKLSSLAKLEAELEDNTPKEEVNTDLLTQENVDKVWKDYVSNITSSFTKAKFTTLIPILEGESIKLIVASDFIKETVKKERDLLVHLQGKLKAPKLTFEFEIDKAKAPKPEKPKRPTFLTPKQKYLQMRKLNPAVDELRKRFDLRPDER